MKNYKLTNKLQERRAYWKVKARAKHAARRASLSGNKIGRFAIDQRFSATLLLQSLTKLPYYSIMAAVFVCIIEVANSLSLVFFNFNLTTISEYNEALTQLLVVLPTILGVVLGLYFSILSGAAGTMFKDAPKSIQDLFLNGRKSNQITATITLGIFIAIYYLFMLGVVGYQPSLIGIAAIVLVSLYSLVAFLTMGREAFHFIHPKEASEELFRRLYHSINTLGFRTHQDRRRYIERESRREAMLALKTFDGLFDFCVESMKISGQQLVIIAQYLGLSLQHYMISRSKIPTDSEWFTTKTEHPKWLLSDGGNLIVALNTGTGLQQKPVRYLEWFEETGLRTIFKVLRHLIKIKDWSAAPACVEILVSLAEVSGRQLSKSTTNLVVDKTIEILTEALESIDKKTIADKDIEGILALYEALGRLPTAALLGMLRLIHDLPTDGLIAQLDGIKWQKHGNFYKHNLPVSIIPELEKIQRSLDNEKPIEGKIVSPEWYLRTLSLHHYLSAIKAYYEQVKAYEAVYEQQVKKLSAIEGYQAVSVLAAACISSCSMEYANKLISLGQETSRLIKDAEAFHGFKDLKWVEIDPDEEKANVIKIRAKSVDRMTKLIGPLLVIPKESREGFPDYLGQSIVVGMTAVYDAARKNDPQRLKNIFTPVLMGAISSRDYLQEDVEGWLQESQITVVTEPLEDILTLSGFIKIYSELHNNPELWEVCEKTWDKLLGSDAVDAVKLITMLSATMSYRDSIFSISPRANIRSSWDMLLHESLVESGVNTELSPDPFGQNKDAPTHTSPLIRIVARGAGMMASDARTIFMNLYLSNVDAIQNENIEFPDRREFNTMYEREMHRYDADVEETDEDE